MPYLSLGYRELTADLLWIRVIGYFASGKTRAATTRSFIDSILALDPQFERIYAWGALAITTFDSGATRADKLAAIELLERGMRRFPDDYRLPFYAGQIYTIDLQSKDPVETQRWQLEGAQMLERAVRIPDAPREAATFAAHLRSKLGQREKAIRDLRELILTTSNQLQRERLIKKLAEFVDADRGQLAYELEIERRRFDDRWLAERPELKPSMYLLVGPPLAPRFRLDDLAVDRDLIGADEHIAPLEPPPD